MRIFIIAGPNGAGKTTFAREFLPQEGRCPTFVNADLIASGLSPFNPELAAIKAARLMLEEITQHAASGHDFAFETTLAGRGYLQLIRKWKAQNYRITLVFLGLSDPELAIARVALRVSQGGHHVPEPIICRRFTSGLYNFENYYKQEVQVWQRYDNSGREPVLIEQGANP